MKKTICLILSTLLLSVNLASCEENTSVQNPESETALETGAPAAETVETAETDAPHTEEAETAAPETSAPETVKISEEPVEINWDEDFPWYQYKSLDYRLYLPKGYSVDEQYPLFVYIHSGRMKKGNEDANPLNELNMFFEHPESPLYSSIVLVPQSGDLMIWHGKDLDLLMELTKEINQAYSTDLTRQYYVGARDGGDAVWDLMERYPERLSACVSSNGKGIHFIKYSDGTVSAVEYFEGMSQIPLAIGYLKDGFSSIGMYMGEEYVTMLTDFLTEQGAENLFLKEMTEYNDVNCPIIADSEDISVLTWLYSQSRPISEEPAETEESPYIGVESYVFNAVEEFETDTFDATNGLTIAYGYYLPENYDESREYPLLVYLHGNGAQGTDGMGPLPQINAYFSNPESPAYDSIVLIPQCPPDYWWGGESIDAVIELIDAINSRFSTDRSRQYIAGGSMGGCGTWDLVLRYPEHVSGAVPVGGESKIMDWNYEDGSTYPVIPNLEVLEVPICYIYDTQDEYSLPYYQRSVVRIMEDLGAEHFTYRESTGIGHAICAIHVNAGDLSVLEWLYAQRRDTKAKP